jgi:RalA-binding protein 1
MIQRRQWQRTFELASSSTTMSLGNPVHSAQGNLLSIPGTPARDRDKHPFPSSQSPLRQPMSSSLSNAAFTSSSIQISPQTMSVDALLKQHVASPDSRTAALEQAVNDRNVLSAQNAQLWKLIEKQRAGYNQILKELERIRGERDGYRSKLVALGALPNGSERRQKASIDRASKPSLDLSTDNPSAMSPSQTQNTFLVQRHNSDDTGHFTLSVNHLLPLNFFNRLRSHNTKCLLPSSTARFPLTGTAHSSFCRDCFWCTNTIRSNTTDSTKSTDSY